MGAAPSAELFTTPLYCFSHDGSRQIALIPFTKEFFPSATCPLFDQLYEACMDPSVRYYVCSAGDNRRRDRIPPIPATRQELYQLYIEGRHFYPTNAALKADYDKGEQTHIRPVPCAVVFLYSNQRKTQERSVCLTVGKESLNVRVIGVVGDVRSTYNGDLDALSDDMKTAMHIQMYITKSSGDHNMARVMLLAAYVYQSQCLYSIGLPAVPIPAAYFMSFKTNIPFLCFLRELRDRIANILEVPEVPPMWLDDMCIHGFVPSHFVQKLCTAFTQHYIELLDSKAVYKSLKVTGTWPIGSTIGTEAITADGIAPNCTLSRSLSSLVVGGHTQASDDNAHQSIHDEALPNVPNVSFTNPVTATTIIGVSRRLTKTDFNIKGYITQNRTYISALTEFPNEVYIVCTDSIVRVVKHIKFIPSRLLPSSVPGPSLVTAPETIRNPSFVIIENDDEDDDDGAVDSSNIVSELRVRRGDILIYREASRRICSTPLEGMEAVEGDIAALASGTSHGNWEIDPTVPLESVLLSLVQDECHNAREADDDDPRWVHDEANGSPIRDGNFYIWHFQRGAETLYYGTVPKFANPVKRKMSLLAGGGGTLVTRDGAVNEGKKGCLTTDSAASSHTVVGSGGGSAGEGSKAPPSYGAATAAYAAQMRPNAVSPRSQQKPMPVHFSLNRSWGSAAAVALSPAAQPSRPVGIPLPYVMGSNGPMMAAPVPTTIMPPGASVVEPLSQATSTYMMLSYPQAVPQQPFLMPAAPASPIQHSFFALGPASGSFQPQPMMCVTQSSARTAGMAYAPCGYTLMAAGASVQPPSYVMLANGQPVQGGL